MPGSPPPSRDLFGPGQSRAIRDLLQSLFAAELVRPSRRLWLIFGWISDIEVLDNRARQFAALQPDWPATGIRLSSVLRALVERGSNIVFISRDVEHNRSFSAQLISLCSDFGNRLVVTLKPEVHEKGILGDDFLLSGSMNLTHNGVNTNDEHLTLRTDLGSVEEWRVSLEQKWAGLLK
jgi:hypothetical protein